MSKQITSGQLSKEAIEGTFGEHAYDAQENWKISCPFHGPERTPSFFIHRTRLICNCFGCGRAGPVDALAAEYNGTTKERAREQLGITGEILFNSVSAQRKTTCPSTYPESWLAGWKRIRNHSYCEARGLQESTMLRFDARWDSKLKRIVFPLRSRSGDLYGASGRSVDSTYPKWYFYWGCNKGSRLYTAPEHAGNTIIVVEGLFDAMWLHQHGIYNVCCLNGSKATRAQVRELRDVATHVIIALDNDDAGREGEAKLFKALRKTSIIQFVDWPTGINDMMELTAPEIDSMMANLLSPVQKFQ